MKKQNISSLIIRKNNFNLPLKSGDGSCAKANNIMVRKRSMGRSGNISGNQIRMQSFGGNNRPGLEPRGTKIYDTSIVKLIGNRNSFDSGNKTKINGTRRIENKRILSHRVLRAGSNGQERKQKQDNKVVDHCYTSLSKRSFTEGAENEASLCSKDGNGKHKKSAYPGKPRSMSTKVCNLSTISDGSYEDGEVIHQEEHSNISVKERRRRIVLGKENLGTLSEISEKGGNTRIVNGTLTEFLEGEEVRCKINEIDSELQTNKRRGNKKFVIFPCLSEVQELKMQNHDSREYEERKSRRSLEGKIGDQIEESSVPCFVRIKNRFENKPETVRNEAGIGVNSIDERTGKTKGILRQNGNPSEEKQFMRSIRERSGSLQRDISAERKISDTTQQLCGDYNTRKALNNKKNERNDLLKNSEHNRVKRGSDGDKKGDGKENSMKSGSKLKYSQLKGVERVKNEVIEIFEEEETNKCGDHEENSFANDEKVSEIANRRLGNVAGIRNRASVGEESILRNIRRVSGSLQTPIRTQASQFVFDFPSGVKNGLNGKGSRKVSIISLPTDPRSMTPRTRKLHQLHIENTIVFKYSERPFGCLACTNCCYRSQTLDEQANHHESKHSSQLPYFCMTCFRNGSKTGFRSKEKLERHLLESEHSMIE